MKINSIVAMLNNCIILYFKYLQNQQKVINKSANLVNNKKTKAKARKKSYWSILNMFLYTNI